MSDTATHNPMQTQCWTGEMGDKWNRHHQQFESMIAPAGAAIITAAAFKPGEHVIDIGFGAGITSIEIARLVAPGGTVTGLDISPVLAATARDRARGAGLTNVEFVVGDATVTNPGRLDFDCLFSRFGVMFFEDPYRAFAHMHGFLRADGRLVFTCWGPPPENPWVAELMAVAARFVDLPQPDPRAPGPFAFADTDYVRDILERAEFRDVSFAPWRGLQMVGGAGADAAGAARFVMDALFVGEALAEQAESVKAQALAGIEEVLAGHQQRDGIVIPAMTWQVSARA